MVKIRNIRGVVIIGDGNLVTVDRPEHFLLVDPATMSHGTASVQGDRIFFTQRSKPIDITNLPTTSLKDLEVEERD